MPTKSPAQEMVFKNDVLSIRRVDYGEGVVGYDISIKTGADTGTTSVMACLDREAYGALVDSLVEHRAKGL